LLQTFVNDDQDDHHYHQGLDSPLSSSVSGDSMADLLFSPEVPTTTSLALPQVSTDFDQLQGLGLTTHGNSFTSGNGGMEDFTLFDGFESHEMQHPEPLQLLEELLVSQDRQGKEDASAFSASDLRSSNTMSFWGQASPRLEQQQKQQAMSNGALVVPLSPSDSLLSSAGSSPIMGASAFSNSFNNSMGLSAFSNLMTMPSTNTNETMPSTTSPSSPSGAVVSLPPEQVARLLAAVEAKMLMNPSMSNVLGPIVARLKASLVMAVTQSQQSNQSPQQTALPSPLMTPPMNSGASTTHYSTMDSLLGLGIGMGRDGDLYNLHHTDTNEPAAGKKKVGRKRKERPADPEALLAELDLKRQRNTESARRSRVRRLEELEELKHSIAQAEKEKDDARKRLEEMQKELERAKAMLRDANRKLKGAGLGEVNGVSTGVSLGGGVSTRSSRR
jgi:hypothetical protein